MQNEMKKTIPRQMFVKLIRMEGDIFGLGKLDFAQTFCCVAFFVRFIKGKSFVFCDIFNCYSVSECSSHT